MTAKAGVRPPHGRAGSRRPRRPPYRGGRGGPPRALRLSFVPVARGRTGRRAGAAPPTRRVRQMQREGREQGSAAAAGACSTPRQADRAAGCRLRRAAAFVETPWARWRSGQPTRPGSAHSRPGVARARVAHPTRVTHPAGAPRQAGGRALRGRRTKQWGHQSQMASHEGRGGAERHRLLADQAVEVEGAAIAGRRRRTMQSGAEDEHQERGGDAEELPDVAGDAIEIVRGDAAGSAGRHLPVGHVIAVGEMPDERRSRRDAAPSPGADRAVIAGATTRRRTQQQARMIIRIEAGVVVARTASSRGGSEAAASSVPRASMRRAPSATCRGPARLGGWHRPGGAVRCRDCRRSTCVSTARR